MSEGGILQMVTFGLGTEEYAVDIGKVQEINRPAEITSLPHADCHIEGVMNLRGKVIPIVNLRRRFGMDDKVADAQSRIMVVEAGKTVGIMVDSVSEVLRVPSDAVEPQPLSCDDCTEFIKGVVKLGDRLMLVLDIDKLLGTGGADQMTM